MMPEFPQVPYEPRSLSRGEKRRRRRNASGRSSGVGRLAVPLSLFVLGGIAAIGAIFSPAGQWLSLSNADAVTPAAQKPVAPIAVPPDNPLAVEAQRLGVVDCLGPVAKVSQSLTRGLEARWLLTHGAEPNQALFSATIGAREAATGVGGISSLYAAPAGGGRCNLGYQSTIYFPLSCAEAHAQVFSGVATAIPFDGVAEAFRTDDGGGRLFLMPAGTGCVAVKTEIFY